MSTDIRNEIIKKLNEIIDIVNKYKSINDNIEKTNLFFKAHDILLEIYTTIFEYLRKEMS